jgi:hypothetical protein
MWSKNLAGGYYGRPFSSVAHCHNQTEPLPKFGNVPDEAWYGLEFAFRRFTGLTVMGLLPVTHRRDLRPCQRVQISEVKESAFVIRWELMASQPRFAKAPFRRRWRQVAHLGTRPGKARVERDDTRTG